MNNTIPSRWIIQSHRFDFVFFVTFLISLRWPKLTSDWSFIELIQFVLTTYVSLEIPISLDFWSLSSTHLYFLNPPPPPSPPHIPHSSLFPLFFNLNLTLLSLFIQGLRFDLFLRLRSILHPEQIVSTHTYICVLGYIWIRKPIIFRM